MGKNIRKICSWLLAVSLCFTMNVGVALADEQATAGTANGEATTGTVTDTAGENVGDSADDSTEPAKPTEEVFSGQLTLDYAITQALANNGSVLEAANNLEKAQMDKTKSDKDTDKYDKQFNHPSENKIYQTEAFYQVLIYAPSMVAKKLEMAQEAYDLAVSSTILNVITQYYTIANYGKTEIYTVAAYNNAINSYNVAKAKYGQGMVAKVDLMVAELQMNTARQTALSSRVNTTNAKRSLMASMGMSPTSSFSLGSPMNYQPLGAMDADTIVSGLIEKSPTVAMARTTYDIAGIQYDCDSRYYLDFSYTAQVAQSTYKNAETDYNKTLLDTKADAYNMVETLQNSERQYVTAQSSLASVQEAYRIAKLQYQYGMITYNDVQSAESEIYSTEAQINSALMQYSIYKTALDNNLIISSSK